MGSHERPHRNVEYLDAGHDGARYEYARTESSDGNPGQAVQGQERRGSAAAGRRQ